MKMLIWHIHAVNQVTAINDLYFCRWEWPVFKVWI